MQIDQQMTAPTKGSDAIFVVNAGSSSVKFAAYTIDGDGLRLGVHGKVEALGTGPRFVAKNASGEVLAAKVWPAEARPGHAGAMQYLLEVLPGLLEGHHVCAVGHRVVHGGVDFAAPARVDEQVLQRLESLCPLAPLHQPFNLAPIRSAMRLAPDLPQVACFDTAFHRTQPPVAQAFALPRAVTDAGLRRYGFHGLSYEYLASVIGKRDAALQGRVVAMHLGNGASVCAMRGGISVATTMGFSALDGLMMGTRCGSIDPGVVLHLMTQQGMSAAQVQTMLYEQSGLLGVSGLSKDMRQLEASDDPRAREAIDLFVYRIRCELGALAATLGGLDAIVFTAGIGENSALIRERVCLDAAWLGVEFDRAANRANGPRISSASSAVAVWVIPTDEELMIARHTLAALR